MKAYKIEEIRPEPKLPLTKKQKKARAKAKRESKVRNKQ